MMRKYIKHVKPLRRLFSTAPDSSENVPISPTTSKSLSHAIKLGHFMKKHPNILNVKQFIPNKYLKLARESSTKNYYLICPDVARETAKQILREVWSNEDQLVCETNAGLGLISSELLDYKIKRIRLYELCPEFRSSLKAFNETYPDRVEIFTKDIFDLGRYAYMDRQDQSNRVESLLKNVPKRNWNEDPVMTIIGTMFDMNFLNYLLKSLAMQNGIANYGRVQIFAFMRPKHYAILSATPKDNNLHAYKYSSVLYNLLFDYKLINKYPRKVFLPWTTEKKTKMNSYPLNLDPDLIYFVQIVMKKDLPLEMNQILPFQFFMRQFFGRGRNRVIPTLEKWIPNCGLNILLPKSGKAFANNIDIFTQFGELSAEENLAIFKEVVELETFKGSSFMEMIERHLLKNETIETQLNDNVKGKNVPKVPDNLTEKLN